MFLASLDPTPFFPQARQSIRFDWISIVYLVILVLSILVGIKRGFFKTLINALGGIIVIVVALLLAKPIGNMLFGTGLKDAIFTPVQSWLIGKNSSMEVVIPVENAAEALKTALGEIGTPAALIETLVNVILPFVPETGSFTPAEVIALGITNYVLIAGAFLVLCIVLFIVLMILKRFLNRLSEIEFIKWIDKTLGGVLGLVVGVCFVCFVSYGLTFLSTLPSCQDFITKTMFLTDDSVWTFSKCIYQYNVVGALFELYL